MRRIPLASGTPLLAALLLALPVLANAQQVQQADTGWQGKVHAPQYKETIFPPWQHGANNPALNKGLEFTVPEINDLPDFHGDLDHPKLVIFVAGNYYFAMAPLVQAFEKEHPDFKGRVFYETLPPGILLKQMKAGGTITVGNMTWTVKPDVFAAGLKKIEAGIHHGVLTGKAISYVSNDLTIMVPKGNPAHITGLADLGKPASPCPCPIPPGKAWRGRSKPR